MRMVGGRGQSHRGNTGQRATPRGTGAQNWDGQGRRACTHSPPGRWTWPSTHTVPQRADGQRGLLPTDTASRAETHTRAALRGLPLTPPGLKRPNAPGQASAIHRNRTTGVISNFSSSRMKMKQGKLILILCFVTPVYPNSILSLVIHEIRNG